MPTTPTHTFAADFITPAYPDSAFPANVLPFKIPNSTTIVKGTIVGELTATPGTVKAYANGNADGSETAKGVMQYTVISDASGNITFGTAATGGPFGETYKTCPVYVSGAFKTTELTGLDAAGLTDMGGKIINGTIADGVIVI